MITLTALTSGVLVAGFGVYQYYRQKLRTFQPEAGAVGAHVTRPIFTQEPSIQPRQTQADAPSHPAALDLIPHVAETLEELRRGFGASSLSLGLASTGLIIFPPLQYATIPTLIYMGAPSARRAYDLLAEKGQPGRALVETVALAICLGGSWYFVGSLGFWLYYLGRLAYHRRTPAQHQHTIAWALPQSVRRCVGAEEQLVPTATLQVGDEVLIATSDIVPVDGVIVDGVAWVQPAGATDSSAYCLKRVGDQVLTADIVIAGRIALRVQKAKS